MTSDIELIDSHSHLDLAEFDADRGEVLARARQAGVVAQVIPAVSAESWAALHLLCSRESGLYPAYGLHPTFLAQHGPGDIDALEKWIVQHPPVAIGECGLDGFVPDLDWQRQLEFFQAQMDIAWRLDLPVIVHGRRAFDEVTKEFRLRKGLRGVVHSFGGSEQQAERLIDLGVHLGIGGPITYPRAKRLRRIVAAMPLEFLLLETDAPDQPLCGHQGQRNEPALLVEVLAAIAELRDCSPESLAEATRENTRRLFALP